MKRLLLAALSLALLSIAAGCAHHHSDNPYKKTLFYQRYLNPANPLDAQIQKTLDGLRANPRSASLHNDLGQLLVQKGFPKDAEREFERAVDADSHFYPAWYNLGLTRAANGNGPGAKFALRRTVHLKPGHAAALFQLGLIAEKVHENDAAIDYYAKAYSINRALLDVHVNPRILDSSLTDEALLKLYPMMHTRETLQFQSAPQGYVQPNLEAPSTQPGADQIVPPTAPVTDPGRQTAPPATAPAPTAPRPAVNAPAKPTH